MSAGTEYHVLLAQSGLPARDIDGNPRVFHTSEQAQRFIDDANSPGTYRVKTVHKRGWFV